MQHANSSELNHGAVTNITLMLYGTKEMPAHYAQPREYNMEYNDLHNDKREVIIYKRILTRTLLIALFISIENCDGSQWSQRLSSNLKVSIFYRSYVFLEDAATTGNAAEAGTERW